MEMLNLEFSYEWFYRNIALRLKYQYAEDIYTEEVLNKVLQIVGCQDTGNYQVLSLFYPGVNIHLDFDTHKWETEDVIVYDHWLYRSDRFVITLVAKTEKGEQLVNKAIKFARGHSSFIALTDDILFAEGKQLVMIS